MICDDTKNLTPTQLRVYSQLRVGYIIQHLTRRTYGLVDSNGKCKRLAPCVFDALLNAGLLIVVDNRPSFEVYAAKSGVGPHRINSLKSHCYACSKTSCSGCRDRHHKIVTNEKIRRKRVAGRGVMPSKNVSLSHNPPLDVGDGADNWLKHNPVKYGGQKAVLTVSPQAQKRWLDS